MNKHTPGPWRINGSSIMGNSKTLGNVQVCLVTTTRWTYPDGGKNEQMNQESKENIKLIAAAPELLEACKYALSVMKGLGVSISGLNKLIEAISKAEGKEV